MITELAVYENAAESVLATVETLSSTIAFGPPNPSSPTIETNTSSARPARCFLLFNPEGKAAGMALYFYNYSTWRAKPGVYLEDLYVKEKERGHGYGQMLLGALAKEVLEMGGARLEWSCLKWNEPSLGFYKKIGAQKMDEWVGLRVDTPEGLEKLAVKAI